MKNIEFLRKNGVDLNSSLELLGDIDTYNEMLEEFKNGLEGKLNQISFYYNLKDMPNYAIYVHSLKSDCKYFGFTKLAAMAYEHEMASKANNVDFVVENYNDLMENANVIKALVNDYLEDEPEVLDEVITVEENKNIILVADDSEVIRLFVKKIFENDYEILVAGDGNQALEAIKTHETDGRIKAILLDLNMPVVDGFAVLDYLTANNLMMSMPVTIISGDSSKEAIDRAFNYNIVDMISKPFSEDKIRNAIMKTMGNK